MFDSIQNNIIIEDYALDNLFGNTQVH